MGKCAPEKGCKVCWPEPRKPKVFEPPPPDEYLARLRLVCATSGEPVPDLGYGLYLSDGSRLTGTTDASGLTATITTYRPASILTLTVTSTGDASGAPCCGAPNGWWESERIYVGGDGSSLAITQKGGQNPIDVPIPKGEERPLTSGEIAMARTVFGDGIDYAKVKVHHGGYAMLLGLQYRDTAITIDEVIHLPTLIYRDDFATSADADKRLFMHEMVHIWQYQMGYPVKRKALTVTIRGQSAYRYELANNSRLADFNMEQQGNIMADYYMIVIERNPAGAYNPQMSPLLLHQIMTPFVSPNDPQHLPRG